MKKIKRAIKYFMPNNLYRVFKALFLMLIQKFIIPSDMETVTVITAVYNGEKHLHDYFKSLLIDNQKYQRHIQIVIVDDGSIDMTKPIIEEWMNKFPQNIIYIYQKNSGQAAARQMGLASATGKWVTFIDADDFIADNYFSEVFKAIRYAGDKHVFVCKSVYYYEESDNVNDSHPLTYRYNFPYKYKKVDLLSCPRDFQLAINCVFIKRLDLVKSEVKMRDIKPQFEDAVFLFEYMLMKNNYKLVLIKSTNYFYRKRADLTSTLDSSKFNTIRYTQLLSDGYHGILEAYNNHLGYVPTFIQNAVIYDLSWNIKDLENYKIYLRPEERLQREVNMKSIFSLIEFVNVQKSWNYLWKLYQIGINYNYYLGKETVKSGVYYFYEDEEEITFELISYIDCWKIELLGEIHNLDFFQVRKFEEKINGKKLGLRHLVKIPKQFPSQVPTVKFLFQDELVGISNWNKNFLPKKFTPESILVFYDRMNKADDNAEVLYEWFENNRPDYCNKYFAIQKSSKDYERLKNKGFNVIDYDSSDFIKLYKKADFILSSGFDRRIENIQNLRYPKFESRAKFIFLQHGIITDDLSHWFALKRYDKIVISTDFERENLLNKYMVFPKQLMQTGLARYDRLEDSKENIILVAPTWREQYKNFTLEQFEKTSYYNIIQSILTSSNTAKIMEKYDLRVHLLLHPEFHKYGTLFNTFCNERIILLDSLSVRYRDQISKASILISDYSSVTLDFAYLKKPVIYFQHNPADFFKQHLYTSELDYINEGLGSVVNDEIKLYEEVQKILSNNYVLEKKYLDRIESFYKYNDKNNCSRIFDELSKI